MRRVLRFWAAFAALGGRVLAQGSPSAVVHSHCPCAPRREAGEDMGGIPACCCSCVCSS